MPGGEFDWGLSLIHICKISMEMLADINKDTVDFMPNFDETEKEPVVLPSLSLIHIFFFLLIFLQPILFFRLLCSFFF